MTHSLITDIMFQVSCCRHGAFDPSFNCEITEDGRFVKNYQPIPKKDRDLREIKNWRPITLLTVDYKIIAKAIANRMKDHLDNRSRVPIFRAIGYLTHSSPSL